METKWTRGPWVMETEAEPDGDDPAVYVCHAGTVCDVTTICNLQPSVAASVEQRQANANLISAAPDMAQALYNWVSALDNLVAFEAENPNDSTKNWSRLVDALEDAEHEGRAALAKARGEA